MPIPASGPGHARTEKWLGQSGRRHSKANRGCSGLQRSGAGSPETFPTSPRHGRSVPLSGGLTPWRTARGRTGKCFREVFQRAALAASSRRPRPREPTSKAIKRGNYGVSYLNYTHFHKGVNIPWFALFWAELNPKLLWDHELGSRLLLRSCLFS